VPVSAITRLYLAKKFDGEDVRQVRLALASPALTESWKEYFQEKLARLAQA
jgi:hypothetical protein